MGCNFHLCFRHNLRSNWHNFLFTISTFPISVFLIPVYSNTHFQLRFLNLLSRDGFICIVLNLCVLLWLQNRYWRIKQFRLVLIYHSGCSLSHGMHGFNSIAETNVLSHEGFIDFRLLSRFYNHVIGEGLVIIGKTLNWFTL